MTSTKALILAGGLGERLRPLTFTTPKCLVPVGSRVLLDYWIDSLVKAGVHEAVINTHLLAEQVRAKIDEVNATRSLRLRESHEPELLGSAGTLRQNRALADEAREVIVIYSDNLSDVSLIDLLAAHRAHQMGLTMLLFHTSRPSACGIADVDAENTIIEFAEKPRVPKSSLANAGVYVLDAHTYREVADLQAFDIGADVLPRFVGRMKGHLHTGYHRDIGTREALEQARADIAHLILPSA